MPPTVNTFDKLYEPPDEPVQPAGGNGWPPSRPDGDDAGEVQTLTQTPVMVVAPPQTKVVNKAEAKVDAVKLAKGRAVFTDDMELPGMLYGALLTSPHAHARILDIDTSAAERLQGVHAVLTYKNTARVMYASGGQSYPQPPPFDQVSLDYKVRHFGDRVAVVAAETTEIALAALRLIEVTYEVLPAVLDPEEAMQPGAPALPAGAEAVDPNLLTSSAQDTGEGWSPVDQSYRWGWWGWWWFNQNSGARRQGGALCRLFTGRHLRIFLHHAGQPARRIPRDADHRPRILLPGGLWPQRRHDFRD